MQNPGGLQSVEVLGGGLQTWAARGQNSGSDGGLEVIGIPEKMPVPELMRVLEEMRISELMGDPEVMRAQRGHPQV